MPVEGGKTQSPVDAAPLLSSSRESSEKGLPTALNADGADRLEPDTSKRAASRLGSSWPSSPEPRTKLEPGTQAVGGDPPTGRVGAGVAG